MRRMGKVEFASFTSLSKNCSIKFVRVGLISIDCLRYVRIAVDDEN